MEEEVGSQVCTTPKLIFFLLDFNWETRIELSSYHTVRMRYICKGLLTTWWGKRGGKGFTILVCEE